MPFSIFGLVFDVVFFCCSLRCFSCRKLFLQRIFILFIRLCDCERGFPSIRLGSSFFLCHISLVMFRLLLRSVAFHLKSCVTVSIFRIYAICYARCAAYSSDYIKINGYQKLCVCVFFSVLEEKRCR